MDSYGIELEFELLWYDDWLEVNKLENNLANYEEWKKTIDEFYLKHIPDPYDFVNTLGAPVEIFYEGEWIKGKIADGYRFRDGIVTVETPDGRKISCATSRTDLYRKGQEDGEIH